MCLRSIPLTPDTTGGSVLEFCVLNRRESMIALPLKDTEVLWLDSAVLVTEADLWLEFIKSSFFLGMPTFCTYAVTISSIFIADPLDCSCSGRLLKKLPELPSIAISKCHSILTGRIGWLGASISEVTNYHFCARPKWLSIEIGYGPGRISENRGASHLSRTVRTVIAQLHCFPRIIRVQRGLPINSKQCFGLGKCPRREIGAENVELSKTSSSIRHNDDTRTCCLRNCCIYSKARC